MKKLIFLLGLIFWPISIYAYENYDINNYLIDAKILNNGNLQVAELIELEGTFKVFTRDVIYKNNDFNTIATKVDSDIYGGKAITDIKVSAKLAEDSISFKSFEEIFKPLERVYYEEDLANGDYLETSLQNGKSFKMFYEGKEQTIIYNLNYTIKSPVVIHQDLAELYYLFLSSDLDKAINNLQIRLTLPDNSSMFRVWCHGDITNTITQNSDNERLITLKKLNKNTSIDIRAVFDKSLITESSYLNKTDESVLQDIIEVETIRAQEDKQKKKLNDMLYKLLESLTIGFLLFCLIWWIYVYIKFDKEYPCSFKSKYYFDIIDDYNVAVVEYLLNDRVSEKAFLAMFLNLLYKKNINMKILKNKNKQINYEFTLINRNDVSNTEEVLLDLLFVTIGKKNKVTTADLLKVKERPDLKRVVWGRYKGWMNCVIKDGLAQNFYEKNGLPLVTSIFIFLLSMLITSVAVYYHINFKMVYILMPVSLAFIFYSMHIKKRSKKGNEDFVKWQAFQRFCEDFAVIDRRKLPDIALWRKYLLYSVVCNNSIDLEKQMILVNKDILDDVWYKSHLVSNLHKIFQELFEEVK